MRILLIQRDIRAFMRMDATALVFCVLVLGVVAWTVVKVGRERVHSAVCQYRMETLGQSFAGYTHDHNIELPPAVYDDGHNSNTWDNIIAGYLGQSPAHSVDLSYHPAAGQQKAVAYLFKCPSDKEPRWVGTPRSYSMPIYDINKAGWPPDENSLGGLGLYLDRRTLRKARQAMGPESSREIPAITVSMVPAPADTALLVECVNSINALWDFPCACIGSTEEQFKANAFTASNFHGGKMNYLMLDGHVEFLLPVQSGGHLASGDQGVWTIRPGD